MDDALSDYLTQMIYDDFLETVAAIAKGADPATAHRAHETRCAPLRRMLADQQESARIRTLEQRLEQRRAQRAPPPPPRQG